MKIWNIILIQGTIIIVGGHLDAILNLQLVSVFFYKMATGKIENNRHVWLNLKLQNLMHTISCIKLY